MKTSLFASKLLSILFYTTLLSTMFVMPLVLAARYDAGLATVDRATTDRDAGVRERPQDAPTKVNPHCDIRLPHSEPPASWPDPRRAPVDRSGPDAAMIKAGKVRAKTIKA